MSEILIAIVGSRWRGREGLEALARIEAGHLVQLRRDPNNVHDQWAVGCWFADVHVGFLPRGLNVPIAQKMDRGCAVTAVAECSARLNGNFVESEVRLLVEIREP